MKVSLGFYVCWSVTSFVSVFCDIPYLSVEKLYDNLLANYNKRIRPVTEQNSTLIIHALFTPVVLICLQTTAQKMTFMGHFIFQWKDEFLRWNSTEYHGVETVRLNIEDIWHPTMLLAVAHDQREVVGYPEDKVMVTSDGIIQWSTEGVFSVVCEMDITHYPFDTQVCVVCLMVSDELPKDVLLQQLNDGMRRISDSENAEWIILDMGLETYIIYKVQLLKYRFLFGRRASFTMYTTVGPLILLAFLNSFVFLVPISSGEKGSIAITVLLSFSVYISSISSALPSNSLHTPLLFVFMTIVQLNSAITVFIVIIESRMHDLDSDKPRSLQCPGLLCSCQRDTGKDENIIKSDSENMPKNNNASDSEAKNAFKVVDFVMFCVSLSLNIVVLSTFAYNICGGIRNDLNAMK